jgi:hypothetical protein
MQVTKANKQFCKTERFLSVMRTLYNLPDGDVEDINNKLSSQVFEDDQPNKSYLTISQVSVSLALYPCSVSSLSPSCDNGVLLFRNYSSHLLRIHPLHRYPQSSTTADSSWILHSYPDSLIMGCLARCS